MARSSTGRWLSTTPDTVPDDQAVGAQSLRETDEAVGARIRLCRLVAGVSQQQLAEFVGVTFQQIQKYESGKNRVSASMLARIAERLRVPVSELFGAIEGRDGIEANLEALSEPGALELLRAYATLPASADRSALISFVESCS